MEYLENPPEDLLLDEDIRTPVPSMVSLDGQPSATSSTSLGGDSFASVSLAPYMVGGSFSCTSLPSLDWPTTEESWNDPRLPQPSGEECDNCESDGWNILSHSVFRLQSSVQLT